MVDPLTAGLLRRHVRGRSQQVPRLRQLVALAVVESRDAKVEHLGEWLVHVSGKKDILGLDVAMHDTGCMCRGQRAAHLPDDGDRIMWRERATLVDHGAELHPVEKLTHDERSTVRCSADVVNTDDVWTVDRRCHFGLALKSRHRFLVAKELRMQRLDRKALARDAGVVGQVDATHAALAEEALDGIGLTQRRAHQLVLFRHGASRPGMLARRGRSRRGRRDRCLFSRDRWLGVRHQRSHHHTPTPPSAGASAARSFSSPTRIYFARGAQSSRAT